MKGKIIVISCLLFVVSCLSATAVAAQLTLPGLDKVFAYSFYEPRQQMVVDGKNVDEVRPIASMTKLVTAYILLQHQPNWSQRYKMQKVDDILGSRYYVRPGETFTLEQYWRVALVGSANNAIKALIHGLGLKEAQVVIEMNNLVKDLGLTKTKFADVTGLSPANVSTAREYHSLLSLALARDKITETLQLKNVKLKIGKKIRVVPNTNKLLGQAYMVAGKTGYIEESGYNFGALLSKDGLKYQLIILGAPTEAERVASTKNLALWLYDGIIPEKKVVVKTASAYLSPAASSTEILKATIISGSLGG